MLAGPREWPCKGNEQSPINVVTKNTKFSKDLKPFHFKGYDEENDFGIKNNGHSAELTLIGGKEISISGGGLGGTYTAQQLHFHWGSSEILGSEHSIDGERYAAELHVVHQRNPSSRSESGGQTSGTGRTIAVLGFFIEETEADNSKYNGIIQALSSLKEKVKLQDLIPDEKELELFYRYNGSLTTPYCNETVTWTLFPKTILLGKKQLEAFYSKLNYSADALMVENFRPIQKLGARTVYTSGVEAVLSQSRHLLLSFIVAYIVSTS
uniref:Carbonic anhydrase n=1 Tax=Pyxicephalus adspersus TaxID=30357 RepID=A0AAV3B5C1_PYXAD|nr:TPA: hypothetical protein GDO54_001148 [Pyxicephalus adspersus]